MPSDAVPLYCDNNGAITLTKESRSYQKFKHIKWRFHLIRDYLEKGYVKIKRVNTVDNATDSLIKSLSQQKIETHLEKMGLRFIAN